MNLRALWNYRSSIAWVSLALGMGIIIPSLAAEKDIHVCEICEEDFGANVYSVKDPIRLDKRLICQNCITLEDTCDICELPAHPKNRLALDDGRFLCRWDKDGAVLDEWTAQQLYEQTKMEVRGMLAHWPPVPGTNVQFHMVNKDQFVREYMNSPRLEDPQHMMGLTITKTVRATNFQHRVYVLSGLRRAQFQAVCAHELAHVWQNEHASKKRLINEDTEEGFCELIAHKFTAKAGDAIELKRIEESTYTKGQIKAFLAAEREYQFYRVINWIKDGVDSWIDEANLSQVLNVRKKDPPRTEPPRFYIPVKTAVPDVLTLKSISRVGARRFALINNKTFEPREKGKVRVGENTVVVTCLDIQKDSVSIQVEGEPDARTLTLSKD